MDAVIKSLLMALPQVNALLEKPELRDLQRRFSHELIKKFCQEVIAEKRQEILSGFSEKVADQELVEQVQGRLQVFLQPRLRGVLNCTGILLHTGLGRAPLLDQAYHNAYERVRSACDLELDLETGERGDRQTKLDDLLCFLTGAEASAIVNNNAAAVLLSLNTLAYRKEVIVARGQLIEIGGSFRLPEVMRKSGAKLVEVGTTNRTYLRDYEKAINPKTGTILLAHSSNYRIRGFVHEADTAELAALCEKRDIPLIHDLGGGVLLDLGAWGLPHEPVVAESVRAGCGVVTFSGDKILGGPQAGLLVGREDLIQKMRRNPVMRALRPDKFTLAWLEESLKIYLSPSDLLGHHPVLGRLAETAEMARQRALKLWQELRAASLPNTVQIEVVDSFAQLGSGALPLEEFPSAAIRLKSDNRAASLLARKLRLGDPPVVDYLRKDWVYLDLKAVADDDLSVLGKAIGRALGA